MVVRTNQQQIYPNDPAKNKTFCTAFRVIEVENLTNKNITIKFGYPSRIIGTVAASSRQKVNSNVDFCGYVPTLCTAPLSCNDAEKVTDYLIVTYN